MVFILLGRWTAAAAVLAYLFAAAPAPAAPATPVGKWVVNFDDQRCMATRFYQVGQRQVGLAFQPQPMSDSTTLLVEAEGRQEGIHVDKARVTIGEVRIGADRALVLPSAKQGHTVYSIRATRHELVKLSAAQLLGFSAGRHKLEFRIVGVKRVIQILDNCMAGLLVTWGLSKEDQARLQQFPEPEKPLGTYLRDSDYPAEAINKGAVGEVEVRVSVGIEGKPSDCRLVRSSGHKSLDEATCNAIVRRAEFTPARDKNGQPMVCPFYVKLHWLMSN